ncbi:MAG: hypothetical protein ACSNEK_00450 [Parachlamydiaceae bacterium]
MNGLSLTLLASGCSALANFFFRKNSSESKVPATPNLYLLVYFFFSFIISLIIYREIHMATPSWIMIGVGSLVGMLNTVLMRITSKALSSGPAGLTFAFQNASAIFPGIFLFFTFGVAYGFTFSLTQVIGLFLVLFGLYWGCRTEGGASLNMTWLKYALACFVVQILAFSLMQVRCVLFDCESVPIRQEDDIWFMPAQFATATLLQGFWCLKELKKMNKSLFFYGASGGLANGGATCLLLLATKWALPYEKTILFPSFSVATIVLCNLWAYKLYNEKFNTVTNATCAVGIAISALA